MIGVTIGLYHGIKSGDHTGRVLSGSVQEHCFFEN